MNRIVVLDTGPLVALLHRDDQYHHWAEQQAAQLNPRFLTCESVLSETHFLLRGLPIARQGLLQLLRKGLIQVAFDLATEQDAVVALPESLRQCANVTGRRLFGSSGRTEVRECNFHDR